MPTPHDTTAAAEKILVEGYRAMPGWRKFRQVSRLTQAAQQMALSRLREQYGRMDERQERLRLASLWLPAEDMVKWFGWDPREQGY